jgi:hypothetical protein
LPNASPHSPSTASGFPGDEESVPSSCQVVVLKAWMRPSPKFPISSAPPKSPNPAGAITMPHGEFRSPPPNARPRKVPFGSKTSTNPFPAPATSSSALASCFA